MHSELITQRIKYLVEEGGLFDDPLADIRRDIRRALAIGVSVVVGCTVVATCVLLYCD